MTVKRIDDNSIELIGNCPSEDANTLLQYLLENGSATVNWGKCRRMHTAVIQVLLMSGCRLTGTAPEGFLNRHIGPALSRAAEQNEPFPIGSEMRNS